ncbi:hypothetical protein FI667_g364, partial [Globisporangium splendens]
MTTQDTQWRPHLLPDGSEDWVRELDLATAVSFSLPSATKTHKPRILVLYGSLREASFSRTLAYECARLLDLLGADVRVFNPHGLPVRDPAVEKTDAKVAELRALSEWSEGHIDWIPLTPEATQGKTVAVLQVNGGSQSFNAVNTLRVLARWMRMVCSPTQVSIPKAWQEFGSNGRMKASDLRDRVVDVMEEFYKFTILLREHKDVLGDRFSERKQKAEKAAEP